MTKLNNAAFISNEAKTNKFIPNFNTLSPVANFDNVKISKQSVKKSLIEHINLLFDKANKEEEQYINIRLLKDKEKPISRFYLLSDIFSDEEAIQKIINLVYRKNLDGYKVCILPCTLNSKKNARADKIKGSGVIVLDIDTGNVQAKVEKLINHFGEPTCTLSSGGITEEGYNKLHLYYKLTEFQTGDNLIKLIKFRGDIASAIEADTKFHDITQIISLLGTINVKYDNKPLCKIDSFDMGNIYNFEDFIKRSDEFFIDNPVNEKNLKPDWKGFSYAAPEPLKLTDGEVKDYLRNLGTEPFLKGNYDLWRDIIFALHHQYAGNEKGKEIALEWSLTDKNRSEENIRTGLADHWRKAKLEYEHKRIKTFSSIIALVDNKKFVQEETQKKPELGNVVKIFEDNLLYDETYVLTENFLCIKVTPKARRGKKFPLPYLQPICNYLKVLGGGNGSKGNSYRLIEYIDTKGKKIQNLLAVSLRGQELQTYLADINLQFNSKYYSLIQNYLLNSKVSGREVNIIHKTGWDEDKTTYSLSYKDGVKTFFVNKEEKSKPCYLEFGANPDEYLRVKGTLEDWKEITRLAKGNDNMIFALGLPFASMWLTPLGEAGRIINLFGRSQRGKSSLLSIASSVLGITIGTSKPFNSWSGTPSALENNCKIRNDSLLILDELHEADNNQTLIEAPYKICNGSGRARMAYNQTTNNNRVTTTWSTLLFSSGERSYPDEMMFRKLSNYIKAGMMNRWADFPAVTEEYGVYATIHEFANIYPNKEKAAEEFCKKLMNITKKNKGHAILEYLKYVFDTQSFDDVLLEIESLYKEWLDKYFYNNFKINDRNSSQEISVAKIFAISAAALYIACKAGIVDYSKEYVFEVLYRCYNKFLANKVDVDLSVEDRLMKKTLIDFLNAELHRGFYNNTSDSESSNTRNTGLGVMYGIKENRRDSKDSEKPLYDYYVEVGKWRLIFNGINLTLVKKFLKENEYIDKSPTKDREGRTHYTYEKHHKMFGAKVNLNKLNLVKIGITLAEDDDTDDQDPSDSGKYKTEKEPLSIDKYITTGNELSKSNILNYELLDRSRLSEFLRNLEKSIIYGIDIETTGLNPSNSIVALLQIYNPTIDKIFIYKLYDEPLIEEEKKLLAEIRFVAHNASFERSFMPYLKNLDCSMIAYHASTSSKRCGLSDLSSDTGIIYNNKKVMQTSDWSGELTEEQLEYAAKDAKATYILWEKYKDDNKPVYDRMYKASFIIDDYSKRGLPVDIEALHKLEEEKDKETKDYLQAIRDKSYGHIITDKSFSTKKDVINNLPEDVKELKSRAASSLNYVKNHVKGIKERVVNNRLPINTLICGTETGRLATVKPNVQNFPRSGFRHIFKARDGYKFIRADFSGQELRMVAAMSNEKVLLDAFNDGNDPHAIMAARLNNLSIEEFTKKPTDWQKSERQKAKAANFGFLYGMGASRFIDNAKNNYNVVLTIGEATKIKNKFWDNYRILKRWSEKERIECKARGYALTKGGRKRLFDDMDKAYCEMINTAVQGSCAEVLLETLIALPDYLKGYLVNTVHDELVFEVPEHFVDDKAKYNKLKDEITNAMITGVQKIVPNYPILNITEIKESETLG